VELGPTETLLADPSHPYTVGLLRSLPRLDRPRQAALTPIEGSPPALASALEGCPFAPRCAWRLTRCWTDAPDLVIAGGERLEDSTLAGHRVACKNQPTRDEAALGKPLTPSFVPAPPPAAVVEAIVAAASETKTE